MKFWLAFILVIFISSAYAAQVELTVSESAGIQRINEPVTSGVPLPEGAVFSPDNFKLTDLNGNEIPMQAQVTSRWGPLEDTSKSIKWILLDFQASLNAGENKKYILHFGNGVTRTAISNPVQITNNVGNLVIKTGNNEFTLSKTNFKLFDSVKVGTTNLLSSNSNINLRDTSFSRIGELGIGATRINIFDTKYYSAGDRIVIHNGVEGSNLWYDVQPGDYAIGMEGYRAINPGDTLIIEPGTPNEESLVVEQSGWGCASGCSCNQECIRFTTPFQRAHPEHITIIRESTEEEYDVTSVDSSYIYISPPTSITHFSGEYIEIIPEEEFDYFTNLDSPDEVTIEENGPMRSVVKIRGNWKSPDYGYLGKEHISTRALQPYPWMKYNIRIHFYKDKDYAKVFFTLENNGAWGVHSETDFVPMQRILFDELSLNSDLNLGASKRISSGDFSETYSSGEFAVLQTGLGGYSIQRNGISQGVSSNSKGWIDINDGNKGVAVGVRHFTENYPKKFTFNGNKLSAELWPSEGSYFDGDNYRIYQIDGGRHKTHEMLYRFYSGNNLAETERIMEGFKAPLMALASPDWFADTKALGFLGPPGEGSYDVKVNEAMTRYEDLVSSQFEGSNTMFTSGAFKYSWIHFGDLGWNGGFSSLHYDWTFGALVSYIRTGKRIFFDTGTAMARHRMDIDQYHGDRIDLTGRKHLYMNYLSRYESGASGSAGHMIGEKVPKMSHTWNDGLVYYYLLTGDKKAWEAADENWKAVVNMYGVGGRIDARYPFTFEESRTPAWAAAIAINLYKVNGNQSYLDLATRIVKNGLLYQEQLVGGEGSFYDLSGPVTSTYVVYPMYPIIITHYYSQDPEIRDLIIRMADTAKDKLFCPEYIKSNGYIVPIQLSYVWRLSQRCNGGEAVKDFFLGDLFAYSYMLTNNSEYLDWARRSFWNSAFYYTVEGTTGVQQSFRSSLGWIDRMFTGSQTKAHGYFMRSNQIYLFMERWLNTQPSCSSKSGRICSEGYYCSSGFVPANDALRCCLGECLIAPQKVSYAFSRRYPNKVHILFAKPLDLPSAGNINNYQINGIVIRNISVSQYEGKVTLFTDELSPGITYTLRVSNILDTYGAGLSPNPTSVNFEFVPPSLVLHYGFEGSLEDSSGTGNDGTEDGITFSEGISGQAGQFDGIDDLVGVDSLDVDDIDKLSVSVWINPSSYGESNWGRIFDKNKKFLSLSNTGGILGTVKFQQTGSWYAPSGSVPLNQWTHVALTYDSSSANNNPVFYINGEKVDSLVEFPGSGAGSSDSSYMMAIGNRIGKDRSFKGRIDEFKLWDYLLTDEEVRNEYLFYLSNESCSSQGGIECSSGESCSSGFVPARDTTRCCLGSCIEIQNPGDANRDRRVNIFDLFVISRNFGKSSASSDWSTVRDYDLDLSGTIDRGDLVQVVRNWRAIYS